MDDVGRWLTGLGLGKYAKTFADNEVDFQVLPQLTEQDLEKLGIPLGHRKKLLQAIACLGDTVTTAHVSRASKAAARAERRHLTVMFCDLADSTALSVRFDPEDLREVIRRYQGCCTHIIKRFKGYISRFMGDGLLVFFGYPQADEYDAEHAVHAGLEIVESVPKIELGRDIHLRARIGIATGEVVVGDLIGEGASEEEAAVGETPNLAARLQGLAEPDSVVIADATRALVGELFEYADLGRQNLKGFDKPVQAWRVQGKRAVESRFEATRAATRLSSLIGRDEEMELLRRRWRQAQAGEGQVVLLVGEPGIGKSHLVHSFREQVAGTPQILLRYYCSPYHQNSALFPVINQLERAARLAHNDPQSVKLDKLVALLGPSSQNVSEVAPLFAVLLSPSTDPRHGPPTVTAKRHKDRTLEALETQLTGLATRQPLVVIFEDLHWSDPTTLELLERLVDRAQTLPALFLITYRPEISLPWSDSPHVTTLILNRLGRSECRALVGGLTGGKPLPAAVLGQIVSHSDGIPLFAEELTKMVLEAGFLQDRGDHYALDGQLPPLAVPTTLKDSLMARLDRLGPVKEVAQIGAVIGRQFVYRLLAALSPLNEAALHDALGQLTAAELIYRRGTPPDASYTFKHALVQDAAYQSLLRSNRENIHQRIAKKLEQDSDLQPGVTPELLAHHYSEGGAPLEAIRHWRRAAEQALTQSAPVEAINHVRHALESLKRLPDSPERMQLELQLATELGAALRAIRGYAAPEVEDIYRKARELCAHMENAPEQFKVEWALMQLFLVRGDLVRTSELSRSLLSHAERSKDQGLLLDAHLANGMALFHLGDFAVARDHLQKGVAVSQPHADKPHLFTHGQDPGVFCLSYLAWTLWFLGYPDQAKQRVEEAVATAVRKAHTFSHVSALCFAARVYQCRRDYAQVKRIAQEMIELARDRGFAYYEAQGVIQHGWALAVMDGEESGIKQMHEGLSALKKTGTVLGLRGFLLQLAEGYHRLGTDKQAVSALDEAEHQEREMGTHCWDAEIARLRGELLAAGSSAEQGEAATAFDAGLNIARRQGARSLELRTAVSYARLLGQQGRHEEVKRLLTDRLKGFVEGRETVDLREAHALLST
jgi:class 3 adenylate cyclase/predicted ATPase